jgi:hypothetical protein
VGLLQLPHAGGQLSVKLNFNFNLKLSAKLDFNSVSAARLVLISRPLPRALSRPLVRLTRLVLPRRRVCGRNFNFNVNLT